MEFSLLNPTRVIAPKKEASSTALPSPLLSILAGVGLRPLISSRFSRLLQGTGFITLS